MSFPIDVVFCSVFLPFLSVELHSLFCFILFCFGEFVSHSSFSLADVIPGSKDFTLSSWLFWNAWRLEQSIFTFVAVFEVQLASSFSALMLLEIT